MPRLGRLLRLLAVIVPLGAGPCMAQPVADPNVAQALAAPAGGGTGSAARPAPAGPAAPELSATADPSGRVEACLADPETAAPSACIGVAAEACLEAAGGIADPAALAKCHAAEGAVWQARLDAALGRLAAAEAASDAAEAAGPGSGRRAALEVAQAAWAAWVAAECGWVRRQAHGGGGEAPAEAACRTRLTAERALFLGREAAAQVGP